ncbi:MAG: transglutaminase domain-containing protein [Desulfobacteraceae bacterium]|nr:MAG: transglutaminase domain-containing protein [Desulfobacteraceae bacterium]
MSTRDDFQPFLEPTFFIDSNSQAVHSFVDQHCATGDDPVTRAIQMYYAIRDTIRYDPYSMEASRESLKASVVIQRGYGYCVAKAIVLAACARHAGIPARLGFADVRNHLNSKRLMALMQTDLFIYHGFTELYLGGKWVKATPAFDINLCRKVGVKPLEFDGTFDSIFHEFNVKGDKHMEYVNDRGNFSDMPFDRIMTESRKLYPLYFENIEKFGKDFSKEAIPNL